MNDQKEPTDDTSETPESASTVQVRAPFHEIIIETNYRGKSNAYVVRREHVVEIRDNKWQKFEPRWESRWVRIAPGIRSMGGSGSTVIRVGNRSHETAITGRIRIYTTAKLPVLICYLVTDEYNDYEDSSLSFNDSRRDWVRYEAASD